MSKLFASDNPALHSRLSAAVAHKGNIVHQSGVHKWHPLPPDNVMIEFGAFYHTAAHQPTNPSVQESYATFWAELCRQFEGIKKCLYIYAWDADGDTYGGSSDLMRSQVAKHETLLYMPTEQAFGEGYDNDARTHLFYAPSGYVDSSGRALLKNDVFRIVHDVVAHLVGSFSFSTRGEINGWLAHRSTLANPLSYPALFNETAAQNIALHAAPQFVFNGQLLGLEAIPLSERPFVAQKNIPMLEEWESVIYWHVVEN